MRRPSYERVSTTTESEYDPQRDTTNSSSSRDELKVKTRSDWIWEKGHACKCSAFNKNDYNHTTLSYMYPYSGPTLVYSKSVIWIALAVLVAWYTRLYSVLESPNHDSTKMESSPPLLIASPSSPTSRQPHRFLLYGAIILWMMNLTFLLYLAVYLPCVRNIHGMAAWNVYYPRAIPTMTVSGIVSVFLFIRSLWPLYGWTTPYIIAIEWMGCLSLLQFIPWV